MKQLLKKGKGCKGISYSCGFAFFPIFFLSEDPTYLPLAIPSIPQAEEFLCVICGGGVY